MYGGFFFSPRKSYINFFILVFNVFLLPIPAAVGDARAHAWIVFQVVTKCSALHSSSARCKRRGVEKTKILNAARTKKSTFYARARINFITLSDGDGVENLNCFPIRRRGCRVQTVSGLPCVGLSPLQSFLSPDNTDRQRACVKIRK